MIVQTTICEEDFEDLTDFCYRERISRSSLINSLIKEFLETTDKERRDAIIKEAKKIKPGRPKGEVY